MTYYKGNLSRGLADVFPAHFTSSNPKSTSFLNSTFYHGNIKCDDRRAMGKARG